MSARTMTITDPAELRGGDLVTLTSTVSPAVLTARLSHDPDVQRDIVTLSLRIPGINGEHSTSVVVRRDAGTGWTVSATREVPEVEPGTRGTIRGLPAIVVGHGRVVVSNPAYADRPTDGIETYRLDQGFVPDEPSKYGSGDLPYGLVMTLDGALLNWRGENYIRQGSRPALPTREQISTRLLDSLDLRGSAALTSATDTVLALLAGGAS